jgi:hypothetical protein
MNPTIAVTRSDQRVVFVIDDDAAMHELMRDTARSSINIICRLEARVLR